MSIWIITGINGQGKTSLMQAIATMIAFSRERNKMMRAELQEMNRNGFRLTIPQHTVATNYSAIFKKFGRTPRKPRIVDPKRLGFANGERKMHYIVPHQFFAIDEAHSYWPSKGETLDPAAENMFIHHRHDKLDFLMATPDFMLIHKRIRQLAGGVEVVSKKVITDNNGAVKVIWCLNIIQPGELNNYVEANPKDRAQYITKTKFVHDGDIHTTYNPTGHKYKFIEGHLDDDFDLDCQLDDPQTYEEYKKYIETFNMESENDTKKKKKT